MRIVIVLLIVGLLSGCGYTIQIVPKEKPPTLKYVERYITCSCGRELYKSKQYILCPDCYTLWFRADEVATYLNTTGSAREVAWKRKNPILWKLDNYCQSNCRKKGAIVDYDGKEPVIGTCSVCKRAIRGKKICAP